MDLNDRYLRGVKDLLDKLDPTDDDYLNVLTLQGRLAQAVSEMRQYGPTENARVEIARVTTVLDQLCLSNLGKSFRSLCEVDELPHLNKSKIYHNLPQPDYGHFVGREQELNQIMRILRPYPYSQEHLVTIDGIGGIGKSALALEVAHRHLRDREQIPPKNRFEAIIWTSAKAATLTADGITPRQQITHTLEDIYTTIAVALQREDITRARAEEQDETVRRALINQRTLLIVDNLETIDDKRVNAFLRELPAPTKCIVTTRHRIDVAYPIRLTEMSHKDALALIDQECDKKDIKLTKEESNMLYHRTGGVPLAIVWSIAQLGYGYGIESVLHRLGQPHDNIAKYCFEGAMDCIRDTNAYKLLTALALIDTDVSRESLGYVTGLSDDIFDRDEGLVQLEKLSLVNKLGNRFDMLPLTRQFVQSEINRPPNFAFGIASAWESWLDMKLEFEDSYWTWLGARRIREESSVILALLDWAEGQAQWALFVKFIRPALFHLQVTGRRVEGLRLATLGMETAKQFDKESLVAWLEMYTGWVLTQQDDMEVAFTRLTSANQRYKALADTKGICLTTIFTEQAKRKDGQLIQIQDTLEKALSVAEREKFIEGKFLALYELGKLARDLEKWSECYRLLSITHNLISSDEDKYGDEVFIAILGNLGQVAVRLGNYTEAKQYCSESINMLRGPDQVTSFSIRLHLWLSEAEMGTKELDKAMQHAIRALELAKSAINRNYIKYSEDLITEIKSLGL